MPRPSYVDSWDLVRAVQAGDREAFGVLYERHYGEIVGRMYNVLRDRPTAEDLAQDVFVRALRGIARIEERGVGVGAWLQVIASNVLRDHFKSHAFRTTSPQPPEWFQSEHQVAAVDDVAGEVVAAETAAIVVTLCAELGDLQREVVKLRFFDGLSVAETAAVVGRQPGAVKALQWRAVGSLRKALEAA